MAIRCVNHNIEGNFTVLGRIFCFVFISSLSLSQLSFQGKRRVSWKIEDRPSWWPVDIDYKNPTGNTAYKPEELDLLISSYIGLPQLLPELPEDFEMEEIAEEQHAMVIIYIILNLIILYDNRNLVKDFSQLA